MADRNGMVQLKALLFYTVSSRIDGKILHGDDREAADPKARFPYERPADAERLIAEKLAEEYSGRIPEDGEAGMTIEQRGSTMVEHYADVGDPNVASPLDTRNTTAFERPIEQLAGDEAGGRVGIVNGQSADDAPSGSGSTSSTTTSANDQTNASGKPLSSQTTAELEQTAKDEEVDISSATNNDTRRDLIQKARDAKNA